MVTFRFVLFVNLGFYFVDLSEDVVVRAGQAVEAFSPFVGPDNPPAGKWYEQSVKLLDYFRIEEETRKTYFETNAAEIFNVGMFP